MRRLLLAVILSLSVVHPVNAATSLEPLIAQATGIQRTVGINLQVQAQERARQIVDDFSHCCLHPGQAEVLAWNRGFTDPELTAVNSWLDSPVHRAILLDRNYTAIGCAHHVADGTHWLVCIFSTGPAIVFIPDPIPDTAMEAP